MSGVYPTYYGFHGSDGTWTEVLVVNESEAKTAMRTALVAGAKAVFRVDYEVAGENWVRVDPSLFRAWVQSSGSDMRNVEDRRGERAAPFPVENANLVLWGDPGGVGTNTVLDAVDKMVAYALQEVGATSTIRSLGDRAEALMQAARRGQLVTSDGRTIKAAARLLLKELLVATNWLWRDEL